MSRLSQFLFRRKPRPAFPVTRDDAISTFPAERAEEANEIAGLVVDLFNGAYVPLDVRYGIAHAVLNAGYVKETPIKHDDQIAFSLARPATKAAHLSIEETVGLVKLLAAHGIHGSDAGTCIRSLVARYGHARAVLGTDPQAHVDDLVSFATALQRSCAELTTEQRHSYLTRLFGSDAVRAADVIARRGASIAEWIPVD